MKLLSKPIARIGRKRIEKMRVTKLVREYIEREVSKRFNEKDLELSRISELHEKSRLQFEKELKRIRDTAERDVKKAIEKCGYPDK